MPCNLLGKFELSGIPPAPCGVLQIEVMFNSDANGTMSVSAGIKMTNKYFLNTLSQNMERPKKGVVGWMVAEAERYKAEDDAQKEKIEARNQLENFCFQVKDMVESSMGRSECGRQGCD